MTDSELRRKLELERMLLRMDAGEDFARYLDYINPQYDRQWFHTQIARYCQMLAEGEIRNLMVFLPPQHGKSTIVSEAFPAWILGRKPRMKIVGCSYASSLAEKVSRNIQRQMDSPEYQALFPDTRLNSPRLGRQGRGYLRNVDLFETVGEGGFYKAVGIGGGLTGTPVDLSIIDDPVKDALEAYSPTFRERVWEWYTSVLLTRLHNDSRQLFIMTRWHEDDLAGRILKLEPEKWTVLSIPAIRERLDDGNTADPRRPGEALWEARHSLSRLEGARQRSARIFSALYQQRPTVEGGNIVKRDWFGIISLDRFISMRDNEPIIFFLDTAFTEKSSNDPSGILAACRIKDTLYITHAQKVRMKFPELVRFVPVYVRDHGYTLRSSVRIEPKANGLSVIDQLKATTGLNVTRTPAPRESKETRLNAASVPVECGRVVLVEGSWNEEFLAEVCGFPAMPHDEYVDTLCYAVDHLLGGRGERIDLRRLSRMV